MDYFYSCKKKFFRDLPVSPGTSVTNDDGQTDRQTDGRQPYQNLSQNVTSFASSLRRKYSTDDDDDGSRKLYFFHQVALVASS